MVNLSRDQLRDSFEISQILKNSLRIISVSLDWMHHRESAFFTKKLKLRLTLFEPNLSQKSLLWFICSKVLFDPRSYNNIQINTKINIV